LTRRLGGRSGCSTGATTGWSRNSPRQRSTTCTRRGRTAIGSRAVRDARGDRLLVLALRTSPQLVYEEALGLFAPEDVAEAFAATRGVTMPSQLRAEIRKDGRDLLGAFRALAPKRAPIRIQRWTLRRLVVTVGALVGGVTGAYLLSGNLTGAGLR
jgi:hypothetical protein